MGVCPQPDYPFIRKRLDLIISKVLEICIVIGT